MSSFVCGFISGVLFVFMIATIILFQKSLKIYRTILTKQKLEKEENTEPKIKTNVETFMKSVKTVLNNTFK